MVSAKEKAKKSRQGSVDDEVGLHLLQVRGETLRATELGWRNLIFIPFNNYWLTVVTAVAIYLQFSGNYYFIFGNEWTQIGSFFTLISWVILVIDLLLSIIHRLWERVNRSRRYSPKSWFVILIDILCAHPVLIIYFMVFKTYNINNKIVWFVIVVDLLRLYRIFVFYDHLKAKIGLNQLLVHLIFYDLILLLLADILSIVWHTVSQHTEYMTVMNSTDKGFWYSHVFLCQLFCSTSSTVIHTGTLLDVVLLLFPMLTSFCINRIFIIILLMDILKKLDHHFNYRSTLKVANIHLNNIGVKKGVKEDFLNFYDTLWDLWWGISWEESLEQLPLSLIKETLVDVGWDAIQHSRSLRFQGLNFKRDLALRVRSVSYRPGDFVFGYGDTKSTLFYLVSGTLQVMSSHDSTCPLISFSRGTILGGGSIIVPSLSNLAVRSASYSETKVLHTSQLFSVALSYPWEVRYMHLRAYDRLQDAYTMMKVGELFAARKRMYDEILVEPEIKCITWLKNRWQLINSFDVATNEEAKEIVQNIPVTEQYTSRYLDIYVISEDLELKKNRFCLEAAWPFVMEPECDFLKFWNAFVLVLLCYDCIALPYYSAFSINVPYFIEHMSIFNQIMFMLDTYFHLITAIKTKDVNIMTAKAIVKYRLKRIGFIIDLISALPIGIVHRIYNKNYRLGSIYGDLFRLFKAWRALKLLVRMESNIKNPAKMPWLRHTIVYLFLIYWASCLLFILACPTDYLNCFPDSWFTLGKQNFKELGNGEDIRCFKSYITISLFFVMTLTHQQNSSNLTSESFLEHLGICFLTLFIQTYVLYCTAHLTAVNLLSDSLEISFFALKKNCCTFLKSRSMPKRLSHDLIKYLDLQWSHNMAHEFLLQKKLFYDAPQKLNAELTNYFKEVLKSYKLFQGDYDENRHMIDKLAEKARIVMLPKYFVICKAGLKASCLTIVRKGYCSLNSHLRSDIEKFPSGKTVGAGSIFPLLEIVSKIPSSITVYTITNCECIIIDEPDLVKAIEANIKLRLKFSEESPEYLNITSILTDEFEKDFHPDISDTHQTSVVLRRPFYCDKTNSFRVLLHLLFPKYCFSPLGAFIYYWEIFRYIMIPITTNFYILYFIIFLPNYDYVSKRLSLVFDSLSILDIYIRFNTGYFNKHGVFVTDTCLVTYHYLTSAFVVDFMAAFPWQILFKVQDVVDLPWLLLSTFKTLSIYRVIRFNLSERNKKVMISRIYTVCVIFVTFVLFVSCNNLIYTCFFKYNEARFNEVYCKVQQTNTGTFDFKNLSQILVLTIGSVIGMILKMKTLINQVKNQVDMMWTIVLGLAMNLLEILFIVKCCRWSVSGLKDYTLFKQNVQSLVVYVKKNLFDAKLANVIEKQFMFYWANHVPDDLVIMFNKIHPTLRVELFNHLYYEKLRMVNFLRDADEYLLRALSFEISEMYVIKGQAIIEEFEISKHIYMISKGEIVVSVGKISPVILGAGCIFGSLNQTGVTKHVFSFEASKNSAILQIEASRFYAEIRDFPEIYRDFVKQCLPSREYIITGEEIIEPKSFIDLSEVVVMDYMTTSSSNYMLAYLIVTYLAAYSTIILLCLVIVYSLTRFIYYALIVVDLLTLWKIITQLLLPYVDPKTGLTVKNRKLIRQRYMKTLDFYIDVITFIPYIGVLWLLPLKLLRIIEIAKKIKERRASLFSKNWEMWIHCFLFFFLLLFILSVVWSLVIGSQMLIYRYVNGTYIASVPITPTENFLNSFMFVSILFTKNGRVKNVRFPMNMKELIGGIIITVTAVIIVEIFLGKISHFVEKVTWNKRSYENKMIRSFQYLKLRELSQCILESVWEHGELLWHRSQGNYIPPALFLLPYPLKKRIMYRLFGRHLVNSYLFKHTHVEFIKNLCARLELIVFFPGESVVVEGDVDGTMYFIHSGEVDVLKSTGKDEDKIVGILTVGQIFGFCQGLYDCRPYPNTYKARSSCEILLLHRQNWHDLMLFYDSQTLTVYKRASRLPYEFPVNNNYFG